MNIYHFNITAFPVDLIVIRHSNGFQMSSEQIIYGKIILGPEPETIEGYICLRDGVITDIGQENTSSEIIISPCLVNSHTHIGDSVLKDPVLGKTVGNRVERDLDSLVKPPDGLKHRTLQAKIGRAHV